VDTCCAKVGEELGSTCGGTAGGQAMIDYVIFQGVDKLTDIKCAFVTDECKQAVASLRHSSGECVCKDDPEVLKLVERAEEAAKHCEKAEKII